MNANDEQGASLILNIRKQICLLCFILIWVYTTHASATMVITYPNTQGKAENAFGYQVLKLALDTMDVDYELILTQQGLTQGRTRKLIIENKVSIADFGSSAEDEALLLPIYFPIDMGLNGWRLLVTHKQNQNTFSYVKDAEDLQYAVLAQGAAGLM